MKVYFIKDVNNDTWKGSNQCKYYKNINKAKGYTSLAIAKNAVSYTKSKENNLVIFGFELGQCTKKWFKENGIWREQND